MKIVIPREIYHRPLRLWAFIASWLLRRRAGYFAILPVCMGLGLAAAGWSPWRLIIAVAGGWLFGWLVLTTHEYGHVTQLLRESSGYAGVWLDVRGGILESLRAQAAWLWQRLALALTLRGIRLLPRGEAASAPESGYLRVGSDMMLAAPAKMRIALAGPVAPLLLWAVLALPLPLLWRASSQGTFDTVAVILAAGLVYLLAHPFFSGVIYSGYNYSDLGYATSYLIRDLDMQRVHPLRVILVIAWRLMRQVPGLLADQVRFLAHPERIVEANDVARKKPKRTCLAWIYQRRPSGEFTDRIVVLAPLGLALLKQVTANPRGESRRQLARLLSNPSRLRRQISYRKVYSVELSKLASRAWALADGELEVREIAARISEESDRPVAEILRGLEIFFRDLHRKYMVNLSWPLEPVRQYPTLPDVLFDYGDVSLMLHRIMAEA